MEQFFGFVFLASLPLAWCLAAMSAMMSRIRPGPIITYSEEAAEVPAEVWQHLEQQTLAATFGAPHPPPAAQLQRVAPSLMEQMTRQLRDAIDGGLYGTRNSIMQEAHERSIELLKEWLTPAQRKQFGQHNYFDVIGSETKTRYRIRGGNGPYNVAELKKGHPVVCLCFVPLVDYRTLALGDTLLAQKIMLEHDEPEALRIANRTTSLSYLSQFDAMAATPQVVLPTA